MMMPSRGLAGALRQGARLNRRFISTTRSRPLAGLRAPPSSTRILQGSVTSLAAHARLASTSAPTTPPTPSQAAAAAGPPPTSPTDALATDANPFDIGNVGDFTMAEMPERIGYLKEIGLDYGWGPTSMVEWSLEHVHVMSGLPWWGSIAATALLYRIAIAPLFIKANENGAKMRAMLPITKPLNEKMMAAMRSGDKITAMQSRQELMAMNKAAGVGTFKMFMPSLIQAVFGFCAFRLLRAMAHLPVPGLETGGLLWITDLTQSDPYFLLPAIMGLTLHGVLRMGGESGAPISDGMKPIMLYAFPGVIFISTSFLPAALDIWLATTGFIGIAQVFMLKNPAVRNFLNLPPMLTPEQAMRDAVASGLAKEPPTSTTIDIKAKSRSVNQKPSYQAPNLKFSNAHAENHTSSTTADAPVQPNGGVLSGVKSMSWFNKLNESYKGAQQGVKDFADSTGIGSAGQKTSSTRTKEFMQQAADYEKKWKRFQSEKRK